MDAEGGRVGEKLYIKILNPRLLINMTYIEHGFRHKQYANYCDCKVFFKNEIKSMKQLVVVMVFFFSIIQTLTAQMPVQLFAGDKSIEYQMMWLKNVDAKQKFSLFNFTYFNIDYKTQRNNTYEIYQVGTYSLTKNIGIAGGGRFFNSQFTPLLAVSYQAAIKDFYISAFPSVQYSLTEKKTYYSLFCIAIYNPAINKTWGLYNQLFFEPMFDSRHHVFSYQQIRVGLDYKKKFQFGIGANMTQAGKSLNYIGNYGLFVRKDLQ